MKNTTQKRTGTKRIDRNFGVHPTAIALMKVLAKDLKKIESKKNLPDYHIATSVFYNGRERNICLSIQRDSTAYSRANLIVCFGECRGSDDIIVDTWEQGFLTNPPTIDDFSEQAYANRKQFDCEEYGKATAHIMKLIGAFLTKKQK